MEINFRAGKQEGMVFGRHAEMKRCWWLKGTGVGCQPHRTHVVARGLSWVEDDHSVLTHNSFQAQR